MFYTISDNKINSFNLKDIAKTLDIKNSCEYIYLDEFLFSNFTKAMLESVYIPLNFKGLANNGKIEDVYCIKQEIYGKEVIYKNIFMPPISPYIKTYKVHDANLYFSAFDNNLMSKDRTILFATPTNYKEKILIDEHVRYIATGALSLSKTIKEIELPLNIKEFDSRFRSLFTVNKIKEKTSFCLYTSLDNTYIENNIDFSCINVLIIANGVNSITYERELDLYGVDRTSDLVDNIYSRVDPRDLFFDKQDFYPLLVCKDIHLKDVKCKYMQNALCMGFLKLKSEDDARFKQYFTSKTILNEYNTFIGKNALSLYHLAIHKNEKNIVNYLHNFIDNNIKNNALIFNKIPFKEKTYFIAFLITTLTKAQFQDYVLTYNKDHKLFLNVFKPYILLIASRYLDSSYLNLILNIDKLAQNTKTKDKYINMSFDFDPYKDIYDNDVLNKDFALYHLSFACKQEACYYLSTIVPKLCDLFFPKLKSNDKFTNIFDNRDLYNMQCLNNKDLLANFTLLYELNIFTKEQLEHILFISYLQNREDVIDFLVKKGIKLQKDASYLKEFLTIDRNIYNNAILVNALKIPNNKGLALFAKEILNLNLDLNLKEQNIINYLTFINKNDCDDILITLDYIIPSTKFYAVDKYKFFISLIKENQYKLLLILLKTLTSTEYQTLNALLDYCADNKLYDLSASLLDYKNKYFKHENITKVLEL